MLTRTSAGVWITLLGAATVGCPASLPETGAIAFACQQSTDCLPGTICVDGRCRDVNEVRPDSSTAPDRALPDSRRLDAAPGDTAASDAAPADAATLDLATPDTSMLDTARLDRSTIDATTPDATLSDTATPDGATLDGATLDVATADSAALDAATPDALAPDAATSDAATPDAATPDAATPDAATPDAARPDTTVNPALWIQTTQADFNAGVATAVDLTLSPDDARLTDSLLTRDPQIDNSNRDAWDDGTSASRNSCQFGDAFHGDAAGYQLRLDIPRGASISAAHLSVFARAHTGVTQAYMAGIRIEDVNVPGAFNNSANNIRGRTYWSTTVAWPISTDGLPVNQWSSSPSIVSLIQHTVDRTGWATGNFVSFAVWSDDDVGGCNEEITDYSVNAASATRLHVEYRAFAATGSLASQVRDTGRPGAVWELLTWDETLVADTDVTFAVRASDIPFVATAATPAWTVVGGTGPVTVGLPTGRYLQWRATLTTAFAARSPTLHEVRVVYH